MSTSLSRSLFGARGRTLAAVATVVTASVALAGCSSAPETVANADGSIDFSSVELNVGEFGPYVQAIYEASGEFDDVPYTINWVDGINEAQPLFSGIQSGSIDVGIMGDLPVTTGVASNAEAKIINVGKKLDIDVDPVTALTVLVPSDSDIQSAEDFAGKTLVTTQGSAVEYLAYLYTQEAGVAWDSFEHVYLPADQALSAFISGDVDIWASYPPGTQQVLTDGSARQLTAAAGEDNLLAGQQSHWVAADAAIADPGKNAALHDFVGRLVRANAWGAENQDQLPELAAKALNLPAGQVSSTWTYFITEQDPIDDQTIADFQTTADNVAAAGIVPHTVEVKNFFTTEFVDDAANALK